MRVMIGELEGKDINHINMAFREWLHSQRKIPTPSDIIKLIQGYQRHDKDMQEHYIPPPGRKNQDWQSMTDEQKEEFKSMMNNLKTTIKPEVDVEAEKEARCRQNYKHFERLSDETKKDIISS